MTGRSALGLRCLPVAGLLLLWLGGLGAGSLGQPALAQIPVVDPAALVRLAIELACAAETGPQIEALRRRLPITGQPRARPVRLSRFGWRGRFEVAGGALTLERFMAEGRLQRISAQYDAADGGGPQLLAMTDLTCRIRTARRLHYDADGRPDWLEGLDGGLEPTGEREELNPPVPARPDPGGVPVALIDTGVNYLLPAISARLARGADGALLGYDYWDLDARPFDVDADHSAFFPGRHGTQTASLLLAEAPVARLLPYRYPRPDMTRMAALVEAAAAAGVRLVNVSLIGIERAPWQSLAEAAARHPEMLFVVAAGNQHRDLDRRPVWPAALPLANLIAVTAATADGELAPDANWGRATVDLMVPAERVAVTDFDGQPRVVSGSSYAAARTSALAACLLAVHPDWQAAELKAAIFALARPPATPDQIAVGFIPDAVLGHRGACSARPHSSGV